MLTITGLSKTYGNGVRALDRVGLTIGRGLFGLLGPNGAGKSTLMRTIAALQEPDEGTIVLDGLDVLAEPQELRRRLGYLPQDFGVYPGISALLLLDHIAVLKGIGDRRARREQVHALLELTNLHEVRDKAVSTFSGGMKQRFGIAQALLGAPSLIVVDEPTAGLDPEERSRFHNLLSEIGENAVVLLSTHIVEDVSDLCPRMAILAGWPCRARRRAGPPDRGAGGEALAQDRAEVRRGGLSRLARRHRDPAVRRPDAGSRGRGRSPGTGVRAGAAGSRGRLLLRPLLAPAAGGGPRMLREIVGFEWRYHSRQAAFLAASLLFLLLGFALSATRFGPDNVAVSSPYLVMEAFGLMSLIALVVASIFAANAVLRDDDCQMSAIVHATPVGKLSFLLGRFGGAFLATLTVVACSGLGMAAGALMPWLPPERMTAITAMDARPYLAAFGVITLPNVLFATALLFAVAVLTRNAIATHSAAVALYILYFVCSALTGSPLMAGSRPGGGGGTLPSLLDPFALTSFFDATRYWTAAEKNARFIPFAGALLANRGIWIAAALGILAIACRGFSFRARGAAAPARDRSASPRRGAARKPRVERSAVDPPGGNLVARDVPLLRQARAPCPAHEEHPAPAPPLAGVGGLRDPRRRLHRRVRLDLLSRHQPHSSRRSGRPRRSSARSSSSITERSCSGASSGPAWRPIVDSTPVSGSAMIAAKWTALAALLGSMLLGGAAAGVALQAANGYFHFQPLLYLSFFYFAGLPLLLYAAASLFIHALSPGKYAGMIFFVLFLIVSRRAADLGLEHDLWRFAAAPSGPYSELNGFGHYAAPFHGFMLHWTVLALLLATMAAALWRRIAAPPRERLRLLARPGLTACALAAAFVSRAAGSSTTQISPTPTSPRTRCPAGRRITRKPTSASRRCRVRGSSRSTARSISTPPSSAIAWRDAMRWSTIPRGRSRACTWRRAGRHGWPRCPFRRRGWPRRMIDSA